MGKPGGVIGADVNALGIPHNKLDHSGLKTKSGAGHSGAGACTVTGAAVGDRVISVFGAPTAGGALVAKLPGTDFESVVTVINQVQQLVATDLSASTFVFLLAPANS